MTRTLAVAAAVFLATVGARAAPDMNPNTQGATRGVAADSNQADQGIDKASGKKADETINTHSSSDKFTKTDIDDASNPNSAKAVFGADLDLANKSRAAMTDKDLAARLHVANQGEIDLAKMALEKGGSAAVKQLAQRMLDDHQQADQQLTDLAGQNKMDLDDSSKGAKQDKAENDKMADELKGLSGADFDRRYAELNVTAHKKALQLVRVGQHDLQQGPLAGMLTQLQPKLQHHLLMAQKLAGAGGPQARRPDHK